MGWCDFLNKIIGFGYFASQMCVPNESQLSREVRTFMPAAIDVPCTAAKCAGKFWDLFKLFYKF
jgi:hypothetical protein